MPWPGRKFLLAGRGGLNLTHGEELPRFLARYGAGDAAPARRDRSFSAAGLARWCEALGQPTFVGSSGRIFPKAFKASPLLRAWLRRLAGAGRRFARVTRLRLARRRASAFRDPGGRSIVEAEATCWRSAAAAGRGLGPMAAGRRFWRSRRRDPPLQPANCGFTAPGRRSFATASRASRSSASLCRSMRNVRGEAVITRTGIEGGAIYALSAPLRDAIDR